MTVKVEFEANDDQLAVLRTVAAEAEGSQVWLDITTPSERDPRLASGGVRDATGGPGLKARVRIVEVGP